MVLFMFLVLSMMTCYTIRVAAETTVKVTFHKKNGEVDKVISVLKNGTIDAYNLDDVGTATFQGWDTVPEKTVHPKYMAGEKITVKKNVHFYPVYLTSAKEPQMEASDMSAPDPDKYGKVITVGSSSIRQTARAAVALLGAKALKQRGEVFLGHAGAGLADFLDGKHSISEELLIKEISETPTEKKTAVIWRLAGTDTKRKNVSEMAGVAREYVKYLKSLKDKLRKYNVVFIFVGMGTVNELRRPAYENKKFVAFNKEMKKRLPSSMIFVDLREWQRKNGFTLTHIKSMTNDGLHFSPNTYMRFHSYLIDVLNDAYA